jgi:hypothetical protein
MRKIIDLIERLPAEDLGELAAILKIEGGRDLKNRTARSLLSHTGLNRVMSSLTRDEFRMFVAACASPRGVTFGELQTKFKIDSEHIEQIADRLARRLLVYVLKNRQRIHNKNDKVYPFPEITEFFEFLSPTTLPLVYRRIASGVKGNGRQMKGAVKPSEKPLLDHLCLHGGIVSYDHAVSILGEKNADSILQALALAGSLKNFYESTFPPLACVVIAPELYAEHLDRQRYALDAGKDNVNNRYAFILNLLSAFDLVSTCGLFLTKQKEFRKVDRARLADSLYAIEGAGGREVDRDDLLQLCLHVMHLLSLVRLKGDSVSATLKPIRQELDRPRRILLKILLQIQESTVDNPLFESRLRIPSYQFMSFLAQTLQQSGPCSYAYLVGAMMVRAFSEYAEIHTSDLLRERDAFAESFHEAVQFLTITGIIETRDGLLALSEIGKMIAGKTYKPGEQRADEGGGSTGSVYINPDFSLLIPRNEVSPEDLYHLLTHTEMISDDVVVNAKITRNSIMRAYKRGMSLDTFLDTLKRNAKNQIPQNLNFTINEWARQTVRLTIINAVLLQSNHPSFLDELSFGKLKHAIVERISPTHAIIQKEYLDELIKTAQDRDAVISLFEGDD